MEAAVLARFLVPSGCRACHLPHLPRCQHQRRDCSEQGTEASWYQDVEHGTHMKGIVPQLKWQCQTLCVEVGTGDDCVSAQHNPGLLFVGGICSLASDFFTVVLVLFALCSAGGESQGLDLLKPPCIPAPSSQPFRTLIQGTSNS